MNKKKLKKQQMNIISFVKRRNSVTSIQEIKQAICVSKKNMHLFEKAIDLLIQSGRLQKDSKSGGYILSSKTKKIIGELRLTRSGFGFVVQNDDDADVYISRDHLNTALNKDIVEVKLYARRRGKNLEGFVTKVIERKKSQFVGTFHKTNYYGFMVPDDRRIYRDFFIPKEKQKDAKEGQKILVGLEKWDTDHLNPEGKVLEILGFPGEAGVDVAAVAYSFGIATTFPERVEKEASQIKTEIEAGELKRRLDLRDLETFTIDPVDAKDYDDAVSLGILENGNYLLGVHIADVSFFVAENSHLDKEAFKRGTSVYLVDRVIPMLPENISNKICSLQPNEDKLTYSCIMELNQLGDLISYEIKPSVINSNFRFTYEEAQQIIDDNKDSAFANTLINMMHLSKILLKKRFNEGGINFETPEVSFNLDQRGFPISIIKKERLDSHRLIEEFMLMANKTVAQHIQRTGLGKEKRHFIYRIHEKPDREKMKNFFEFLHALKIKFQPAKNVTSQYFQILLNSIKGRKEEIVIEEVALRSMMKAVYSTNNIGHFGLGFEDYTHFTSPIRRYPDLTVHRLLKQYGQGSQAQQNREKAQILQKICEQSNITERTAMEAERESIRLKQGEYISQKIGEEFKGIISGVMSFGIFVELIDTLVEGLVHIRNLDDDFYIYDEKTYTLIGRDTGFKLRLGDEVKIRVDEVNLEEGKVDFALIN